VLGMRSGKSQSPVPPMLGDSVLMPRFAPLRDQGPVLRASRVPLPGGQRRYRAMGVGALVLAEQRFSVSLQNLADDLGQPSAAP
jgi:hypothetical protein